MQEMGHGGIFMQSGSSGWGEGAAPARDNRSFQDMVMRALHLRPIYREVFILCDVKGYTASEASAILAITEAAVSRRLRRARLQMSRNSALTDS